jgi:mediator of RNA polymerase II transcription subunit 12, fungi type
MCDWHNISSLLSPWRLAVTAIQLQFTLRQMGRLIIQESTSQAASDYLDKLTANLFHHSMTSEEAYFVAEMARGVDGAVAGKACDFDLQNAFRC